MKILSQITSGHMKSNHHNYNEVKQPGNHG